MGRGEGGGDALWQEFGGDGKQDVELWREGDAAAHADIALEFVKVEGVGRADEIDHGGGCVDAGMDEGVGGAEEAVEHVAAHVGQGEGEEEEGVFPAQGELEGALATGGVVDFTDAEGHEGLANDPPVGEAFLGKEDARDGVGGRMRCHEKRVSSQDTP
jgi:hypothetical protein